MNPGEIERILDTAREAVGEASRAALRHFAPSVPTETKADRTPVTQADRDAEAAILAVVRRRHPDHAVLTEESGALFGDRASRWIVDPIDGTRGFSRGGSSWGPLVAFEHEGRVVAGAIALPALGRTYWAAQGMGSYRDGVRLKVSTVARWEEATLSLGEPRILLGEPYAAAVGSLIRTSVSARCPGDLAGCAMLLDGRAECWLEAGVKPWDIAALEVLVEEAGGKFSDFRGGAAIPAGQALASNGLLHAHVLQVFLRDT